MKALNFALAATVVGLSACSPSGDRSTSGTKSTFAGSQWYDYGNGLINLNQVKNITSNSTIQFDVTAKEYVDQKDFNSYYDELPADKKAIVSSHFEFCYDQLHAQGDTDHRGEYQFEWSALSRSASIGDYVTGGGTTELKDWIETFRKSMTAEFAKACVVKINGNAAISFDGFSVSLPNLKNTFRYDVDEKSPPTDDTVRSAFDRAIGELANGVTPWNKEYANVTR